MAETPFRIPGFRDIERLAFEGRISMQELCRRAGVHPTTFRHWKSGRSSPSVAIVQALLDEGEAAAKAAAQQEVAQTSPRTRRSRTKPKPAAVPARLARRAGRPA